MLQYNINDGINKDKKSYHANEKHQTNTLYVEGQRHKTGESSTFLFHSKTKPFEAPLKKGINIQLDPIRDKEYRWLYLIYSNSSYPQKITISGLLTQIQQNE